MDLDEIKVAIREQNLILADARAERARLYQLRAEADCPFPPGRRIASPKYKRGAVFEVVRGVPDGSFPSNTNMVARQVRKDGSLGVEQEIAWHWRGFVEVTKA